MRSLTSGTKKTVVWLLLVGMVFCLFAPLAWAAGNEEKVTNDFADYLLKILQGPVAKILAAVILFAMVISLYQGRYGTAIACGFSFLVLIFLPKLIEVFK